MRFFLEQPGESFARGPCGFGVVALPSLEFRAGFIARRSPDIGPRDPFSGLLENFSYVCLHRVAPFGGAWIILGPNLPQLRPASLAIELRI